MYDSKYGILSIGTLKFPSCRRSTPYITLWAKENVQEKEEVHKFPREHFKMHAMECSEEGRTKLFGITMFVFSVSLLFCCPNLQKFERAWNCVVLGFSEITYLPFLSR